jgi:hypothetical protein
MAIVQRKRDDLVLGGEPEPTPILPPSIPPGTPTSTPAPTPAAPTLADTFDQHFKGSLAGQGQTIVNTAYKYGIDPTLFAAITATETGYGTSSAVKNYNNPAGLMDPQSKDQKGFQKFDSIEQGLDAAASNLKRNYIDKGLTTPGTIGPVYAPVNPDGTPVKNDPYGTNKDWPIIVSQVQKKFGGGLGLMN